LGGRDHLALLHEEPHDVGRGAVQLGAEVLRRRGALDDDDALGHRRVDRRVGGQPDRLELLADATATTLAARRAAIATRTAGATTGTAAGATTGTTERARTTATAAGTTERTGTAATATG